MNLIAFGAVPVKPKDLLRQDWNLPCYVRTLRELSDLRKSVRVAEVTFQT